VVGIPEHAFPLADVGGESLNAIGAVTVIAFLVTGISAIFPLVAVIILIRGAGGAVRRILFGMIRSRGGSRSGGSGGRIHCGWIGSGLDGVMIKRRLQMRMRRCMLEARRR